MRCTTLRGCVRIILTAMLLAIAGGAASASYLRDDDPRSILKSSGETLASLRSLAYAATYTRTDQAPGEEIKKFSCRGWIWLERRAAGSWPMWKISILSWIVDDNGRVEHEGAVTQWAYDGTDSTLLYPEKRRAVKDSGQSSLNVVTNSPRSHMLLRVFFEDLPFAERLTSIEKIDGVGERTYDGVICDEVFLRLADNPQHMLTEVEETWSIGRDDKLPRRFQSSWDFDRTKTTVLFELTDVRGNAHFDGAMFAPPIPPGYEIKGPGAPVAPVTPPTPPTSTIPSAASKSQPTSTPPSPPQVAAPAKSKFEIGDAVPDFTLKDAGGDEWRLSDRAGKAIVLLDFWGTWCGPCRIAMSGLQRLHERFHDAGVEVVGIACKERDDAAPVRYMNDRGYTYTSLVKGDDVAKSLAVDRYPTRS